MKNKSELQAALNMVLARLESNPRTSPEWDVIATHLNDAWAFAGEVHSNLKIFEDLMQQKLDIEEKIK